MDRPLNIDDLAPDIRAYILHLEQKISDTDEDGVRGFLIVMNRKINQIKRSVDAYDFKIDNTEDKAYERFWSACLQISKVAKDMKDMKTEYGISDAELSEDAALKKLKNPMERMVYNKKQVTDAEKDHRKA